LNAVSGDDKRVALLLAQYSNTRARVIAATCQVKCEKRLHR
jgi:hypothetical protein